MVNDRATILVVDDDKLIAGFLNDLLAEAGYEVRLVHTGQEALDRLASPERDEIDLVLLDVMMPDVDGFTVLTRLRAAPRTEHLIVVMVTGRDNPEKTRGLQLGADDYIAKPFDANELLARVNAMLRLHRAEQGLWVRNQALAALNAVAQTIGRAVELPDVLRSALDQVLVSLELIAGFITLRAASGPQRSSCSVGRQRRCRPTSCWPSRRANRRSGRSRYGRPACRSSAAIACWVC